MSDNPNTPEPGQDDPTPSPAPSAETKNTVPPVDDNRIPYARFKEVNDQNKALQERLDKLEAEAKKRQEAEMSDLEKLAAREAEAKSEAETLRTALEQERQQRLDDRRDNAVAQALASAQAIDADETVDWLRKNAADAMQAVMKEDGTFDPDQIKTLVDKAKADRPHHFRPGGPGSPSNRGGELPAANMTAGAAQAAEFLRRYGFEPDEKRLSAFIQMNEDEQATS